MYIYMYFMYLKYICILCEMLVFNHDLGKASVRYLIQTDLSKYSYEHSYNFFSMSELYYFKNKKRFDI